MGEYVSREAWTSRLKAILFRRSLVKWYVAVLIGLVLIESILTFRFGASTQLVAIALSIPALVYDVISFATIWLGLLLMILIWTPLPGSIAQGVYVDLIRLGATGLGLFAIWTAVQTLPGIEVENIRNAYPGALEDDLRHQRSSGTDYSFSVNRYGNTLQLVRATDLHATSALNDILEEAKVVLVFCNERLFPQELFGIFEEVKVEILSEADQNNARKPLGNYGITAQECRRINSSHS